eukprot:TRINITY_DN3950_c0_g1_i1.p1 TRINITY_DN3950_c0_g1~~TRINITY_DN3950_c0_g1_i1.p1  ORF type:complete len:400 (+),score=81.39 TRINITY_DN3950_c0_g1_i1:3-1202(+)
MFSYGTLLLSHALKRVPISQQVFKRNIATFNTYITLPKNHRYTINYVASSSQTKHYFHSSDSMHNTQEDLYAVLGVAKTATADEIKRAYYQKAKKFHPDSPGNKGNSESKQRFAAISTAYEILSDEKKRSSYDKFGHAAFQSGIDPEEIFKQFQEAFGKSFDPFSDQEEDYKDFNKGANVEHPLTLTFEEAIFGTEKSIDYNVQVSCLDCNGTGGAPQSRTTKCISCDSLGYVKMGSGLFQSKQICTSCKGYGTIIDNPCTSCKGQGTKQGKKKLKVKIPPGVDDDHLIRVADKGDRGYRNSQKNGDLYIHLKVSKHDQFKRLDYDIHHKKSITVAQAMLGDKVKIPTVHGDIDVEIPAGTQPGDTKVIKGKGVSVQDGKVKDKTSYFLITRFGCVTLS